MSQLHFLFAVIHEARPLLRRLGAAGLDVSRTTRQINGAEAAWAFPGGQVVVSGMGQRRAGATLEGLDASAEDVVVTSGFAGGLNPALATGDVVFDVDANLSDLVSTLEASAARPARFACEARVATTREEKAILRGRSGADVVEMESGVIREICRRRGLRSATIRVISDAADEDLPLDFNALMTPDMRMDYWKLAWSLVGSPGRIPALIRFQSRLARAAANLAAVLIRLAPAVHGSPQGPNRD